MIKVGNVWNLIAFYEVGEKRSSNENDNNPKPSLKLVAIFRILHQPSKVMNKASLCKKPRYESRLKMYWQAPSSVTE